MVHPSPLFSCFQAVFSGGGEEAVSPSEDQAEQGADQNEDLVEHG